MLKTMVKVAVMVVASLMAACGGSGGLETYKGNGISFQFPDEFRTSKSIKSESPEVSNKLWETAIGVSNDDGVFLMAYKLKVAITPENFEKYYKQLVDESVGATPKTARVTEPPEKLKVGGLPAFEYTVEGELRPGVPTRNRAISVYSGTTQILISCQTRDEKHANSVDEACDSVITTLKVD